MFKIFFKIPPNSWGNVNVNWVLDKMKMNIHGKAKILDFKNRAAK